MSDWYGERSELQRYVDQADAERAEALARLGYAAIAAVGRLAGAALGAAWTAGARFAAWRDRRAALRELLLLDDRMLRDIGLTRAEARAAVEGTQGNREPESAEPVSAGYVDVALTGHAVAGCNDNGERRQVA